MNADSSEVTAASSCGCSGPGERPRSWRWVGRVLVVLGLCAACCLLPLAIVGIGMGAAWMSALDSMTAYTWWLIGAAVALSGYGLLALYRKSRRRCVAGVACATGERSRPARMATWAIGLLVLAGIAFECLRSGTAG